MVLVLGLILICAVLSSASSPVQAQDFFISMLPSSVHVRSAAAYNTAYYSLSISSYAGFSASIGFYLTYSATPSGQTIYSFTFHPSSTVTLSSGQTVYVGLIVTIPTTTTDGTVYSLTVTATGGGKTHYAYATLTCTNPTNDYWLAVTPSYTTPLTVIAGQPTSAYIAAAYVSGTSYSGSITLSVPMLATGMLPAYSTNPIVYPTTTSSTLTLQTTSATPNGTHYLVLSGYDGTLTHTTLFGLVVQTPDFTITATPSSRTIKQGEAAEYTVTLTSVAGFSSSVDLSVSGLPSGATASFDPDPLTPMTSGAQSILAVTTSLATPTGTNTLTVTGTGGGKTHTKNVTLIVQTGADFTVAVSPNSQILNRGSSQTFTVTITSIGGFNKPVYLSLSGHQTGVIYDFNPNPVTPSAGGSATSTLTVYASATASLETRTLTITASAPDPGITHTGTVSLTVAGKTDTLISCSLSVSTIRQGQNVTISGSITPNPGANNDVILEYSNDGGSTWGSITTVKTDSGGSFSHVWSPGQGDYKVRSRWDGSATYNGATSAQQSLTVQPPGCVIATATYGSELSPEVQFLRGFRDGTVMATFAGSEFMKAFNAWYYSFSPYIADLISKQPLLKEAMKILLYPLIGILHISALTYSTLSFSPELAIVATGLVASSLIGIIYFAPLSLITLLCMKRHRKFRLDATRLKSLAAIWIASIALICIAEVTATQTIMMLATAILVLSTLTLTALATTQKMIQKLFRTPSTFSTPTT